MTENTNTNTDIDTDIDINILKEELKNLQQGIYPSHIQKLIEKENNTDEKENIVANYRDSLTLKAEYIASYDYIESLKIQIGQYQIILEERETKQIELQKKIQKQINTDNR